ncbi:tetratricopeptide repeat protein [Anaerococcus sp. AGMB00486]|uniref:Tetratricopeptide repeat protein n=1 Tax=Anaerococcus faecalis TaxID=2742993 RepID=A0ABX2NB90_9FIRM|nr:tetratricopeptide repeat protein [Anaerococcus faecalis]NVF11923.1 tetratricopeptide repeat protein [Anaerococcus faecalis]
MKKIDQYFLDFTDKLAYIDLKKDSSYELLNKTPLALYTDDMSENIISGDFENRIKLNIILDGLIINIAIDPDFKYKQSYIKILENYLEKIGAYTAQRALKIGNKKSEKALLLLRGGYIINPFDKYNAYNYARALWPKAYEDTKYKDEFIKEALRILQEIILQDEDFPLSYYELGNIYQNLGEYIKARSYYENALRRTEDLDAKDEIRSKISTIFDNAEIEEALYYIGKGNYEKAMGILTRLLSKTKRADAYYYLGVCYQNIGQYENSSLAFENSLDKGGEFRQLYNDYSISLYALDKKIEAIEIINSGLKKYPEDPRMIYNRIQINIDLGNLKKAKEDIDNLETYDDLSDELSRNLQIIKDQFNLN